MTNVIIGCPVKGRTWILPLWYEYIKAALPHKVKAEFVVVCPKWDTNLISMCEDFNFTILHSEEQITGQHRLWADLNSYHTMVELRNQLLDYVSDSEPDFFISVDSDILVSKSSIAGLLATYKNHDDSNVVCGLTYLDPIESSCTNMGSWQPGKNHKRWNRVVSDGVVKIDIPMAYMLMDKDAYNCRYDYNMFGEDFGFALELKSNQLEVYGDCRYPSKHIMEPKFLDIVDKRVGW